MEKKRKSGGPERAPEIRVTVHHADNGPSLESCMVSILARRLSGRRV